MQNQTFNISHKGLKILSAITKSNIRKSIAILMTGFNVIVMALLIKQSKKIILWKAANLSIKNNLTKAYY